MTERVIPCSACSGTGWTPYHQRCNVCRGLRSVTVTDAPKDEDRWAWNHFGPEPGDLDDA